MKTPCTLEGVAAAGLCSGCGLCEGLAPGGLVRLVMTAEGYLRPRVSPDLPEETEKAILALCPGIHQKADSEEGPNRDVIWGSHRRAMRAHAVDEELRFKASSGGVISALCTHLLEAGKVDFVLHVRADAEAPLRSVLQLSRTRHDVILAAAARYGPAAPLATIGNLLGLGVPFAVVGKPCDIAGLRNLARIDARVDDLVRYKIAFFCAGVSSLRISEQIVAKYGLRLDDVRLLRYRGHGCPGATHIEAKDGRVFEQSYDETWSSELNQEIQFRCKICPDAIGEQADIVCGDAWVGAGGYAYAEHDGWNSVIVRTERGDELLRALEARKEIVSSLLAVHDLDAIQPHQRERKQAVLARLLGLALAGRPLPDFRNLRLLRSAMLGWRRFAANLGGSFRRARQGSATEDIGREGTQKPGRETVPVRPDAVPAGAYWLLAPLAGFAICALGIPLCLLVAYSLWSQDYLSIDTSLTLANFAQIFAMPLYLMVLAKSIGIALAVMILSVVLAYPIAYFIAFHAGAYRLTWLVLVSLPFWSSYLLRIFSWKVILGYNGVVNSGLIELGLISTPIESLLYSPVAVILALTHAWVPFVVLPIYVSMTKIGSDLVEAAADLGGNALQRFRYVILPLSMSGVISGALLVFIPTVGDYVTPALVGGTSGSLIGNLIQAQFGRANNWPLGAALSIVMMICVTFVALCVQGLLQRVNRRTRHAV